MHNSAKWLFCSILILAIAIVATAAFFPHGPGIAEAKATNQQIPGQPMFLSPAARQALQAEEKAFPSDDAGFSAYYRMGESGSYSLNKKTVDDYIFSPVEAGDLTVRTAPATLVDVGANYTVATLTIQNIDALISTVNLYYDDEGWIVAYLSDDEASALVWQAREISEEDPKVEEIGDTLLLEAINIVVDEALSKTAIEDDDSKLGHYHWQLPDANNFLMMVISRDAQGPYAVQFAVPDTLTLHEISASLWVSQWTNDKAPCAKVELDDKALIAEKCTKGIYSGTVTLANLANTTAHTWKLTQSERDEGSSGSMMIILYESPS